MSRFNSNKILRDANRILKRCSFYKENCDEDEKYEILYILAKDNQYVLKDITAFAAHPSMFCYRLYPYEEKPPENLWGFGFGRDLYNPLAEGAEIVYISPDCHYCVWCDLAEYIELPNGAVKYLQYCKRKEITAQTMLQEYPKLDKVIQSVVDLMRQS